LRTTREAATGVHTQGDDRRKLAAVVCFGLSVLAGLIFFAQERTAKCDWASAIGSVDSTHAFKEGTGPSWWLFLGCTVLLAVSAVLVMEDASATVRIVVAPLVWITAVIVLYIPSAVANPCHSSNEPPVSVICKDDDWKTLDNPGAFVDRHFKSRKECIHYFRSLGWP
jgi:hypothetical protein